jgi:hypothetical protein
MEMQDVRPPTFSDRMQSQGDSITISLLTPSHQHYDINVPIIKELGLPPAPPGCFNLLDYTASQSLHIPFKE